MPATDPTHAAFPRAHRPATQAPLPTALALGMIGALGEELLAQLVGSTELAAVYAAVTQPIGTASPRFRPWVPDHGVIAVDEAWVCLTDAEPFVPRASPMQRYRAADVPRAARLARRCGARRFVLVAPLSALLQMSATTLVLDPEAEITLREMGFAQLVIVRPTAAEARDAGRGWMQRLVNAAGRAVADIVLPGYTQVPSARTAARAIVAAARAAPEGTTVLGARDLLEVIAARLPGEAPKKRRWR
jgi:hypothetical protein